MCVCVCKHFPLENLERHSLARSSLTKEPVVKLGNVHRMNRFECLNVRAGLNDSRDVWCVYVWICVYMYAIMFRNKGTTNVINSVPRTSAASA